MASPGGDRPEPIYEHESFSLSNNGQDQGSQDRSLPFYNVNNQRSRSFGQDKTSDEDGTVYGDGQNEKENLMPQEDKQRPRSNSHLTVQTEYDAANTLQSINSHSVSREQRYRHEDDLEMLKVEHQVSRQAEESVVSRTKSREGDNIHRSRSRKRDEHVDEFDAATNPVHEKTQVYKPVEHPSTGFGKFMKRVHGSHWLIRWVTYITPPTLVLLIPLLLGSLVYKRATVGGVFLMWFIIWLEIVWLTLWAGRILAKCLPWPIGLLSSLITNNSKKWRDMGKQLELPATLFFWWLAIEVSFLPTMTYHQRDYKHGHTAAWMVTMNKVLVSIFVAAILNFIEKIIIQLIAISFHLRTYADRIEINKFQIGSLTKLYKFSKDKIAMEDSEFENREDEPASGARTPGQIVNEAAKTTKVAFSKFGDVAGKIAGDFTGKQTMKSTHPHQVILTLLSSTSGAQILARRLYRTFAREETETVVSDDLRSAFDNDEEAEAAFSMFDKDMNGDISMEELEAVCVEIGRERKSITASLKDLDSVVSRLDDVFMFIVFVITILVFLSLISTSAAGVLASAGSAVLALSWLFSATAQEFLQSVIFVFVKHPFDIGDRVTIYGNTGVSMTGDDYFVKKISLLYTEFKKMEGHIVQAPNSYLNTLFILNQRRSGGLAEAISISIKFGTTLEQIDGLRTKLLEFVTAEMREYQGKILTELRDIVDVHSMNLNIIFFYKSNWQNEGLRLARRNKFICAMMVSIQEMNIEGPWSRFPGQKQSFPMYLQNVPHVQVPGMGHSGHANAPDGLVHDEPDGPRDPPFVAPLSRDLGADTDQPPYTRMRNGSILRGTRPRGESLAQMNRRVDFSLGAKSLAIDNMAGDVYESRSRGGVPADVHEVSREREMQDELRRSLERSQRGSVDAVDRHNPHPEHFMSPGMQRHSTDSATRWHAGQTHRNRFFGRGRPANGNEHMLESGMADIPEVPSTAGSGGPGAHERLDPRTGILSTRAWRSSTEDGHTLPPHVRNNIFNTPVMPDGPSPIGRSQTDNLEMRRMR